ncbi:MAG: hypothetical protein CME70_18500 [Halobacteriovorax sp.]|nr:hypothetical protein [Halobacteriovorax sp.]|tara:strand:+ start:2552 stop:3184 length:633 start_codon:yes stop_codon:yes gene_type:complete
MWNSINIIDQFAEDSSDLSSVHDLALSYALDRNLSSGSCAHRVKSITSLCDDCAIDRSVLHLIQFRSEAFFNYIKDRIKCVETWVNFSDRAGKPLGLHLDMDESRFYWDRKKFSNILDYLPIWSCSIFVSPDEISGGGVTISTALYNDHDSLSQISPSNLDESHWVKVPYKFNRAVIFDASYPYLTNPHRSEGYASVLHLNFWDKELTKF